MQMIKKYSNNLSKEMSKLMEIESNPDYIFQKSKNYRDLQIGIAPDIKIGLEVEANNDVLNGTVEPTEKQLQMLSDKETLKDSTLSLEEKLYSLMDILFDDDQTKQMIKSRNIVILKGIKIYITENKEDSI